MTPVLVDLTHSETRDLHQFMFFFLNEPATPEIYPLPLHDALPICLWALCLPADTIKTPARASLSREEQATVPSVRNPLKIKMVPSGLCLTLCGPSAIYWPLNASPLAFLRSHQADDSNHARPKDIQGHHEAVARSVDQLVGENFVCGAGACSATGPAEGQAAPPACRWQPQPFSVLS